MQRMYARKPKDFGKRYNDSRQYRYSYASQRARVTEAFKQYQFGNMTQQEVGNILCEIGEKMQLIQPPTEPLPFHE